MARVGDEVGGWSSRGPLYALGLAIPSALVTVLVVVELHWSGYVFDALRAIVLTLAVALWLIVLREIGRGRSSLTRLFPRVNGSALRDSAKARLGARGWELVEEAKSPWFSAVVYRLRFRSQGRLVAAEVWSHGNRARVILRFRGPADEASISEVCAAFSGEDG